MLKFTHKIGLLFLVATYAWGSPVDVKEAEPQSENANLNPKTPEVTIVEPAAEPVTTNKKVENMAINQEVIRESRRINKNDLGNTINIVEEREVLLLRKLNSKCSHGDITSCMMVKMVSYMNRLLKKASIPVFDGLELTQTSTVVQEPEEKTARAMVNDSEAVQLSRLVTDKLWAFVKSRAIRWNILPETDVVVSANPDDQGTLNLGMSIRAGRVWDMARGKKNNLGPILAAAVLKIGLMGAIAFKALALLVGKSIILSKIALLLAAILWLKKIFSQQRHVTYEVVAHPHHSHSSGHDGHHGDSYSSGWGRKINVAARGGTVVPVDAQSLAYNAQKPATAL